MSITKRTTKKGQFFWVVTDHRGAECKIWNAFEEDGESVDGERLAALVEDVVSSAEPVALRTRETRWGVDLLAVERVKADGSAASADEPDPEVEPDDDEREELDEADCPF